jgi:hypothetical protein
MASKPLGMDRNARKRLSRLTSSDAYGPKYRKLTKGDQRQVDELVRRNAGREARGLLNDLDSARRAKVRHRSLVRRRVDKFDKLPDEERTRETGRSINADNDKAFWDMYADRRRAA